MGLRAWVWGQSRRSGKSWGFSWRTSIVQGDQAEEHEIYWNYTSLYQLSIILDSSSKDHPVQKYHQGEEYGAKSRTDRAIPLLAYSRQDYRAYQPDRKRRPMELAMNTDDPKPFVNHFFLTTIKLFFYAVLLIFCLHLKSNNSIWKTKALFWTKASTGASHSYQKASSTLQMTQWSPFLIVQHFLARRTLWKKAIKRRHNKIWRRVSKNN